jgi:NAD(P)-dependent dehydrogenase (short-subunit alcohol dehydrogenase family)
MKLPNKMALITGAGSGFGLASALLFSREGARVAIADIDEEGGRETLHLLGKEGRAIFVPADVSVAAHAEKMIRTTVETVGRLFRRDSAEGSRFRILDAGLTSSCLFHFCW